MSIAVLLFHASCTNTPPPPPAATSADGVNIEFDLHGDHGPALVLVHGWTNDRTFWDPHLSMLSEDHRVVTLDLAGFGESGAERTAWTMESFGQDVVAVVDALGLDQVVLVGFSMGGAVVLEAAEAMPERTAGVILVDIFQDVTQRYDGAFIEEWEEMARSSWHDEETVRGYLAPRAPDSLVQRYIRKTPAVIPDHWWQAIREFWTWSDENLTSTIQGIEHPIVAVNAEQPPTNVDAFRQYAPSFEVMTIPEVAHLGVIWMNPSVLVQRLTEATEMIVGGT